MGNFICSKCHREYTPDTNRPAWEEWYGDKDLYEKWTHFQLLCKGEVVSEPLQIISIYRPNDSKKYISVNTNHGSYPYCTVTEKDNILDAKTGYKFDKILLLNLPSDTHAEKEG